MSGFQNSDIFNNINYFYFIFSAPKLKQRMSFLVAEYGNLQGLLDATRVADVVLFLMSADRGVDKYGDHCLDCVVAQGVPAHVFACQVSFFFNILIVG